MADEKIKVQNESGDHKYFTIVPNYILNHSTAIDQSLYLQMKRMAGEDGKCFATQQTLMDKMKISRKSLKKSIQYLLSNGWIDYIGRTGGKTRPIKTYKVNDIWKQNDEFYTKNKEIPSQRTLSIEKDTVPKNTKIPSQRAVEEEPIIKKNQLDTATPSVASSEINPLIDKFKEINPSYEKFFANKSQRSAIDRLVKQFGVEQIGRVIDSLPAIQGIPYAPTITTPIQLEDKLAALKNFIQKEQLKNNKSFIMSIKDFKEQKNGI